MILETLARKLRFGPLSPLYERYALATWERKGTPVPPPYTVKRLMIRQFALRFGCKTLVETGTFRGDTIWTLRSDFQHLYSIELDQALYEAAVERFAGMKQVTLIQGDSGEKLKEVVVKLTGRTLFWLDGHYCGEGTGKGIEDAPVMRELETVFNAAIGNHIVMFDDARMFTGYAGYPTVEALSAWVKERRPAWTVEVLHDVIRIYPDT